jgi:hypothetical protein
VINRVGERIRGETLINAPDYLTKIVRSAIPEYRKRVLQNIAGIPNPHSIPAEVSFGNAQNLPLKDESIDLIVTSPPYASNAIDYMRAHKFSLVWFGYSINTLGKMRHEYIGDEGQISLDGYVFPELTSNLLAQIEAVDRKKTQILRRYYYEMMSVLREMFRVLKPYCASIVVVGNTTMRGMEPQTAECLADIGKSLGFVVPKIGVRQLDRNKRMMPAGMQLNLDSQIQQRMHEEYVIGFYKPK